MCELGNRSPFAAQNKKGEETGDWLRDKRMTEGRKQSKAKAIEKRKHERERRGALARSELASNAHARQRLPCVGVCFGLPSVTRF